MSSGINPEGNRDHAEFLGNGCSIHRGYQTNVISRAACGDAGNLYGCFADCPWRLTARGENSLQRDDERQAEEGWHVVMRLVATGDR